MERPQKEKDFLSEINKLGLKEGSLKKFLSFEFLYLTNHSSFEPKRFKKESKLYVEAIENYYKYPMILTRSVFRGLSKNKSIFLTFEDYVNGFLKVYTKPLIYRVEFIFKMFNINKDDYMQKLDVSLILNYTHLFYKCKNQDLLKSIIDKFFNERAFFNFDNFVNNIKKKNSDLFFVVLAILFENENFNDNVLNIFEDENISSEFKEVPSIIDDDSHLNKHKINDLFDLKEPTDQAIQYLLLNYGYDLSFLKRRKPHKSSEEVNINSSLDSTGEEIDTQDDEEEMMDLFTFENDIQEIRYLSQVSLSVEENFCIPKGSLNYYSLNNGILGSAFSNKVRNSRISTNRSLNMNVEKKEIIGGPSSFAGTFRNRKVDSIARVNSFKDFAGSENGSSFRCSSIVEGQEEEIFIEEIFIKKKNNLKKFFIKLVNGFLLLLKKKKTQILTVEKPLKSLKLKKIIPLRYLYVKSIEEGIVINQIINIKLDLISTAKPTIEDFSFLFENRRRLNEFLKLIIEQTNYVSISSEYTFVKDIGKGGFCQVKLMRENQTGELFSVKKISKVVSSIEEFESLNWEKDIVTFLSNSPGITNIIKYHRIIESCHHLYIVMDYIPGGSLSKYLTRKKVCLSSELTKKITEQIFNGVRQLHSFGIIHRDLKLDNVLMDMKENGDFEVKIIDFGLSQVMTPFAKEKKNYGTLYYCSPEILLKLPYNLTIDVWSIGIMAYYLEYTFMPFGVKGSEKPQNICNMIVKNQLVIPNKHCENSDANSKEAKACSIMKKVISCCLCKNILQRPSSEKIFSLLLAE